MTNAYPGLSAAEWQDINQSVLEAMGFVLIPAAFSEPNPDAAVDDLYGEAAAGAAEMRSLSPIGASFRYKPHKESLERMGLKVGAEALLFIPRGEVHRWETAQARTFAPDESGWGFTVAGKTYNVFEVRTDPLPVGDGSATDYIGMVVTGYKET